MLLEVIDKPLGVGGHIDLCQGQDVVGLFNKELVSNSGVLGRGFRDCNFGLKRLAERIDRFIYDGVWLESRILKKF
jgi:hypothetical protein